jgi:hypothetical protein
MRQSLGHNDLGATLAHAKVAPKDLKKAAEPVDKKIYSQNAM